MEGDINKPMKLKMKNTEFGDFAEDLEKFLNAKTIDEAVSILSDRIKKRFNKFFILDENITIYRCRIINDLNEIKTIQNITYPDPKKIELGHARLNQKDEALFYGASHNMTSFTETVPDVFFHENVPVLACISEWTNQTKIPTFQLGIVGMDRLRVTKTGQPLPDNHEQLIFEELVHQLFKFPDVDYYLQTTALRKYLQLEADKLKNPWTAEVPDKIVLERIEGPDGKLDLKTPAEYEKKLRELYPDAFERYFKKLTLVE